MRDKKEQAVGVSVYIKILTGGQAWRIHWMRRLLDRQVFIWEEGLGRLEHCGTAIRIWEVLGTLFFFSLVDTPAFAIHGNREEKYAYTATSGLFFHQSSNLFFPLDMICMSDKHVHTPK